MVLLITSNLIVQTNGIVWLSLRLNFLFLSSYQYSRVSCFLSFCLFYISICILYFGRRHQLNLYFKNLVAVIDGRNYNKDAFLGVHKPCATTYKYSTSTRFYISIHHPGRGRPNSSHLRDNFQFVVSKSVLHSSIISSLVGRTSLSFWDGPKLWIIDEYMNHKFRVAFALWLCFPSLTFVMAKVWF